MVCQEEMEQDQPARGRELAAVAVGAAAEAAWAAIEPEQDWAANVFVRCAGRQCHISAGRRAIRSPARNAARA